MNKITAMMLAAAASLGLAVASTGALAQKAETPKDAPKKAEASKDAKKPAEPPKAPAADAKKAEPMDINTATEKELATLKGIGHARAKAIIKHRPYKGKDEIVAKAGVPKAVYEDIKEQIIAKQDMAKPAEPPKKPDVKPAEPPKKPEK
jgi:DNA uptake protein ComE-like DNA-binding protein